MRWILQCLPKPEVVDVMMNGVHSGVNIMEYGKKIGET